MNNWLIIVVPLFFVIIYLLFQLQIDYLRCELIIKKNSKSFYKAFSQIRDKKRRKAVYAVYAFCRLADDIVDNNLKNKSINNLKKDLDRFVKNNYASNFIFRALKDVRANFYKKDFDFKPYYLMIDGQKMDLSFKAIKTYKELLNYCYHVAGSVGLMLVPILAKKESSATTKFAIDLGNAFQITNILRDIGEDYRNNRVYLPSDIMKLKNYKLQDLKNGKISKEFIATFEELAKKAEGYYSKALNQLKLFHPTVQFPLGSAIVIYQEILNACRESNYDVFSKKNYVNDEKKVALIKSLKATLKE